jgi:hypothetical protein
VRVFYFHSELGQLRFCLHTQPRDNKLSGGNVSKLLITAANIISADRTHCVYSKTYCSVIKYLTFGVWLCGSCLRAFCTQNRISCVETLLTGCEYVQQHSQILSSHQPHPSKVPTNINMNIINMFGLVPSL